MPKPTLVNKDDVTLSIGEVAKAIDVSPATLRRWEQDDLIRPARTAGGQRVFRQADLKRARKIVALWRDGLNSVAIARELGPIKVGDEPAPAPHHPGDRVRALRRQRNMTLVELADAAGVSVSFLSAFERGRTGVSMENLFRIGEALGTTLPDLGGVVTDRADPIVRPNERDAFVSPDGEHVIENLMARPGSLEVVLTTLYPGAGSDAEYSHAGQEFLYVLSGKMTMWLEDEPYDLSAGSSLHFQSAQKHRWRNTGKSPAKIIWVNAPSESGSRSRGGAHNH